MTRTSFKFFSFFSIFFFSLIFISGTSVYNEDGHYKVEVETLNSLVFNNNIETDFSFKIINNLDESQDFSLIISPQSGWDISTNEDDFVLKAGEEREVKLNFKSNSAFDYTPNVVSPDMIKISQNDEYSGFFEFPVEIVSQENVSLRFKVNIKPIKDNLKFITKIQKTKISPVSPIKFTVSSEAILDSENVEIFVNLGDYEFKKINDIFSSSIPYKIYQLNVPSSLSPGNYDVKVTVKVLKDGGESAQEWYSGETLEIIEYNKISVVEKVGKGIFRDRVELEVTNLGNVNDVFSKEFKFGFFKGLLFGTDVEDVIRTDDGVYFEIPLNKAETKKFIYSFNYLALMIVVFVILVIIVYFYVRKNSNPLAVQTQLYEVKRVKHEGVKSVKIRIGFENIKEHEIDKLKVVFRMPTYLQVKDDSFSLTEPKHVLKGDVQYKLIWDFKRFEKGDTRLLGFTVVNKKGILGDIRIPDLEMEVKIKGKTSKYYKSFSTIKG